jgi:hypothetical protein
VVYEVVLTVIDCEKRKKALIFQKEDFFMCLEFICTNKRNILTFNYLFFLSFTIIFR